MKKHRIVIASVLKPVDDTRMFEKMGVTLSESGQYDVTIIGYPSTSLPVQANIRFIPLPPFSRLSFSRVFLPLRILYIVYQVNPDILVVNTHELLIVAVLNRILFGTKIIYDIRENYYRNILYTASFPSLLRPVLAGWVRLKEKVTAPLFRHFFLAEAGYQKEMSFFRNRYTVIENKATSSSGFLRNREPGKIRLLFSGTLAESTGAFEAIRLARRLHAVDNAIHLDLVGYTAKPDVLTRIRKEIAGAAFIQLHGGDRLVPHPEIIQAIYTADFGIVCYPPSRHTENSIPTKLYEYLSCRLPILLQHHPPWVELASRFNACITMDAPSADPALLLEQMKGTFYTIPFAEGDVTWESEARKLLSALRNIFA